MNTNRYKDVSDETLQEIFDVLKKRKTAQTELRDSLVETLKIANRQRSETEQEMYQVLAVMRLREMDEAREGDFPLYGSVATRNTAEMRQREINVWVKSGWFQTVSKLDKDIAELVANFSLDQLKAKFGGLRYYITVPQDTPNEVKERIQDLIRKAEASLDQG